MKFYTNNKLKKTKKWIITGSVLGVIALFLLTINLIPPVKVMEDNPFLVEEGELPMLCAHRGGKISNPENTLKAYKNSLRDYDIDIMETDLWLTKDNHLVLNPGSMSLPKVNKEKTYMIMDFKLKTICLYNLDDQLLKSIDF